MSVHVRLENDGLEYMPRENARYVRDSGDLEVGCIHATVTEGDWRCVSDVRTGEYVLAAHVKRPVEAD